METVEFKDLMGQIILSLDLMGRLFQITFNSQQISWKSQTKLLKFPFKKKRSLKSSEKQTSLVVLCSETSMQMYQQPTHDPIMQIHRVGCIHTGHVVGKKQNRTNSIS